MDLQFEHWQYHADCSFDSSGLHVEHVSPNGVVQRIHFGKGNIIVITVLDVLFGCVVLLFGHWVQIPALVVGNAWRTHLLSMRLRVLAWQSSWNSHYFPPQWESPGIPHLDELWKASLSFELSHCKYDLLKHLAWGWTAGGISESSEIDQRSRL